MLRVLFDNSLKIIRYFGRYLGLVEDISGVADIGGDHLPFSVLIYASVETKGDDFISKKIALIFSFSLRYQFTS